MLQADIELDFHVTKISINRNGSALLLAGSDGVCGMYLYGCSSAKDSSIICRYTIYIYMLLLTVYRGFSVYTEDIVCVFQDFQLFMHWGTFMSLNFLGAQGFEASQALSIFHFFFISSL